MLNMKYFNDEKNNNKMQPKSCYIFVFLTCNNFILNLRLKIDKY